jgi:arylsulfatase A
MLFNLTKDKKESTNVAKTETAVVDKAKTYLTKIIEKSSKKIWKNN